MLANERVKAAVRWLVGKIRTLKRVAPDVEFTVIARNGAQEGVACGNSPD